MSLLFSFLDMLLIAIMLFDTLGIIYQFRRKETVKPEEYIRVYFSWILFLTIYNTFSCDWKGFFGTLIRLILFAAKVYVTIPLCGGAIKIHKYLIEDDKAKEYFYRVYDMIKSKLCKCENNSQNNAFESRSETTEPESVPDRNNDMFNQ